MVQPTNKNKNKQINLINNYTLAMGDNSTLSRQSMKKSSAVDLSVKIEYDINVNGINVYLFQNNAVSFVRALT